MTPPLAQPGGEAAGHEVGASRREAPVRLVVALGSATGVIYGVRLLEVLRTMAVETHLVLGRAARRRIPQETSWTVDRVEGLATRAYDDADLDAPLASPAFDAAGMVIAPCGVDTVAALANSLAGSLVTRAGDLAVQAGRPLVVAVRETPLHLGHLRAMLRLAEMGAVILPPLPAFYPRPRTLHELIDHTVGRILDRVGIPNALVAEWRGTGARRAAPSR